jgi:hypothetical protein
MSEDNAAFALPENLAGITDQELAALSEQAVTEFDAIYSTEGGPRPADIARATELADAIEAVKSERDSRIAALANLAAQRERVTNLTAVRGDGDDGTPDSPDPDDPDPETPGREPQVFDTTPAEPAAPAQPVQPQVQPQARTAARETGGFNAQRGQLNASLRNAQAQAPDPHLPQATSNLVITAAAATSGAPIGHRFDDMNAVARFMGQHAKSLSVTNGNPSYTPIVSIHRPLEHVMGENTDPATVERTLQDLTRPDVLVAAGGWCAPSEIRYDFFNVACQERSQLIDLPVIGIDRGGIRWPVSPSLADVFSDPAAFAPFGATFSNASVPWLWTEVDDILAVTGTGVKPCIRVPCPSFAEARLECFGYCVTAGNLADAAFPEATRNFLQLLMAANIRVENFRYLAQMVSLSTLATAVTGAGCTGGGVTAPLLGALELAALDYRARYGMCDDDILEVVLPTWIKGAIRSDLAKRTGVDMISVTDAQIADWFDSRGVRVQLVGEYQSRTAGYPGYSTPSTAWPTTVEFMIYAAGTFVRGDGMTLDLGVVRDSTLNAKNDHTAAWAESCHLIAKFGHESRRYVVPICTDGTTGAADLTACCL